MITRIPRSALAAVLVLGGIGAAHAEGPYVGGNLGTPDYSSTIDGVGGNGSGVAGKLFGGYQFTPNFALEGGYFDLGHIDDGTGRVKLRGAYLDAVGLYEFAPKWSVLGRAGLAEGRFTSVGGKDSSPALKLGAGIQYDLTDRVALRTEYERYRFTDAFDAKANVGVVSVGLKVAF